MRRIIWEIICPAGAGGRAGLFGQRLRGSEMSLCLFKGQQNQWAHFLRHGSDLSQWHQYQSRGGSAPRLAARRICLRRRQPWTAWRLVYLLTNVSPRLHTGRQLAMGKVFRERYRRKKLISGGRLGPFAARPNAASEPLACRTDVRNFINRRLRGKGKGELQCVKFGFMIFILVKA